MGICAGVVLGAGSGTRFGAAGNKVYLPLAGRPVLAWSVALLAGRVDRLLLVYRDGDRQRAARVAEAASQPAELVAGGATRHDSELRALRRLAPDIQSGRIDVVVIHDGARPLATPDLLSASVAAARRYGAAIPALPLGEVLGWDGGADTELVRVQTPQAFRAEPLLRAYESAERDGFDGTDTASCFRRYTDLPVHALDGDPRNVKVTYAADLDLAERLLVRGGDLQVTGMVQHDSARVAGDGGTGRPDQRGEP